MNSAHIQYQKLESQDFLNMLEQNIITIISRFKLMLQNHSRKRHKIQILNPILKHLHSSHGLVKLNTPSKNHTISQINLNIQSQFQNKANQEAVVKSKKVVMITRSMKTFHSICLNMLKARSELLLTSHMKQVKWEICELKL